MSENVNASREDKMRDILQQLRVLFRNIQAHSRWVEKQCGVSAAQLWALWELHREPGLRVSDLSRVLSVHQSTASNMLDKLEEKGLIRRERGGTDQRVVRLYVTAAGEAVLQKAPDHAQGAIMGALVKMPDPVIAELTDGLSQLISEMGMNDDDKMKPIADA
jgi:DNA-binding MarR family transcriptional regulator